MDIPTDDEIRALHEAHAPSEEAFDLVHTHCRIVCEIAERIMERTRFDGDADLVRAGCLLHDIGVYRLAWTDGRPEETGYVRHGVLGHGLLDEAGFPEVLCRFCSRHVGVGITRADVVEQRLPIPVDDYLPESPEEELVMYADKFHTKAEPPVFLTADSFATRLRRRGEAKVARFRALVARYGEPDLTGLAAEHGHPLA
ncbi:HD domain-containing protein [Spirillospora albida]|uniref:HD domain-containing protein n=1 Tax=Spirillospora albida TaxID=58123 RepID=UPI0004C1FE30|nr:HD domain-containing protein [Spirillospora albida]